MKPIAKKTNQAAFTLIELLTVMAIIAVVAAFAAPALSVFNGNNVSRAVYNVSDVLEQARAYAMSKNTYVYIGVLQDSNSSAGSMVIGVVASSTGTQMFSAGNPSLTEDSSAYHQIARPLKLDNVQTVSLAATNPTGGIPRQVVPSSYKLGDSSFDPSSQSNPTYSFSLGSYAFRSSAGPTGTSGITSEGMLQIDPQGVVSEAGGDPQPFYEIGLKPVNGNQANYAAVQIAGFSGAVQIYRP